MVFCVQIRGREARFEVEVGVSGFSKEKLLVTGTEGTAGWAREMETIFPHQSAGVEGHQTSFSPL